MRTKLLDAWKRRTAHLQTEALSVYLAYRDPRVPWYAKLLIVCAIGYAFSPIDELLNSIPIIGYLDHLILVPLGVVLAFKKMIPSEVLTDCREQAMNRLEPNRGDGVIVGFVCVLLVLLVIVSSIWVIKDWDLVLGQWLRWFTRTALISGSNAR